MLREAEASGSKQPFLCSQKPRKEKLDQKKTGEGFLKKPRLESFENQEG